MLLFGHIGITTGAVRAYDILTTMPLDNCEPNSGSWFSPTAQKKLPAVYWLLDKMRSQLGSIDYRLVLLGSLLPDILDKPPWYFATGDLFPSGRAYAHTFLFNLVLFICGLIAVRRRKSWLLTVSLCSFMHLVEDQMWNNPVALWWPLLGSFQRVETTGWLSNIIHVLTCDASVYIPEIIGLIIILLIAFRSVTREKAINFTKTGAIG